MTEQVQSYIGIDVSKESLDMAAYPSGQIWKYSNNKRGIGKIVSKLVGINAKLIVMEATGGLEVALRDALARNELPVAVVNPRVIRDFGRAMGMLAKTDKLDAKVMAYYAAKIEPTPRPIPSEEGQVLESLLARRGQLTDMLTAEKNRLKQSRDASIYSNIKEHIDWLETEIKDIEKKVKSNINKNPNLLNKVDLYKSMKGVGDVLSVSLVAMLPELGILNQREIAALVGLAPVNRDSGKLRGKRTIWGGRAMIRKALYMPTLIAVRFNLVIRNLYERLTAKGKLKKVALVACMHKMLTILNSMAKNNTRFSYSRAK
jgi:transposase